MQCEVPSGSHLVVASWKSYGERQKPRGETKWPRLPVLHNHQVFALKGLGTVTRKRNNTAPCTLCFVVGRIQSKCTCALSLKAAHVC